MSAEETRARHLRAVEPAGAATSPRTLGQMILAAAERHAVTRALRWKEDGVLAEMTYDELGTAAREIARGLIALGVDGGDKVAVLGNTRPEWTLADLGALCAGAIVVPVYHTNSAAECQYVLEHSGARVVFCEDAGQVAKIEQVRAELPELEHVISMADGSGDMPLDEVRARGGTVEPAAVEERVAAVAPDDVATLVYTSGTTGPPKGCMLTHSNLTSAIEMAVERLQLSGGSFFLWLPLAHVLARLTELFSIHVGATLAFWQRDTAKLLDDVRESNPTHLASVPRMFEKIYAAATAGVAKQSRLRRAIFDWAIGTGRKVSEREQRGARVGGLLRRRHALADRLVLAKIRGLFGDRLGFAITGAAPIAPEVLSFFDAAGVPVLEGYGMTETSGAATVNTLAERRVGTVGRPLPRCEVRIAEDGEILLAGPHLFAGYFKNPEATAETVVDGWLHTGDLGLIDEDGFVHVTGRKKDLIITSSGKNITPSNIENALKESRWIAEAVAYGDRRPYLVALITLDEDERPKLAEMLGVDPDPAAMARDECVRAEIQKVVDAANERFARIEQVKRFAILDRELSQAEGELTPTMKVKRDVVNKRYAARIAAIYDN
ncbi:MAG: AMP-dependent synthetase/ligase [Gaiellaceae bacterium]